MKSFGLKKGTVKLVPYNPEWQKLYEAEKKIILAAASDKITAIQHIGSTAIPGMPAKPIIHILVAIQSLSDSKALSPLLEKIGYHYRELPFKSERVFFVKGPEINRQFHLSLVEHNSNEWKDSILFCEYLRANKDVAKEYADLKVALAKKYENDRDSYTAAKQKFIRSVIKKARS